MDIRFDSDRDEVGHSLMKTLSEIKSTGETPELKMEILFKYARMKFFERAFQESYEILRQTSNHIIKNGLSDNLEIIYWVARIFEEQGELQRSLATYKIAFEKVTEDEKLSKEIFLRILNIEKNID